MVRVGRPTPAMDELLRNAWPVQVILFGVVTLVTWGAARLTVGRDQDRRRERSGWWGWNWEDELYLFLTLASLGLVGLLVLARALL